MNANTNWEPNGYSNTRRLHGARQALWLGSIVTDSPLQVRPIAKVTAGHPAELLKHWARLGCPRYGVEDFEDRDCWTFSNDLQEAAAIGFKWLERNCALEQIPEEQDGEVVYAYVARGVVGEPDLEHLLYSADLWNAAGADMNELATPEIMTRVRMELFKVYAAGGGGFFMLDFAEPEDVRQYLADWANDIEEDESDWLLPYQFDMSRVIDAGLPMTALMMDTVSSGRRQE